MLSKIPVYILLGQSNMDGRGYWPTRPTYGQNGTLNPAYATGGLNNDTIVYWKSTMDTNYNGAWANLEEFVNNVHPRNVADDNYGPEMGFMVQMATLKGTKCALIKLAVGGSGLNTGVSADKSWNVSSSGDCFTSVKTYIEDALDKLSLQGIPDVKAMAWFQGWSDSDTLANAQAYEANGTALFEGVTGIRSILGGMNAPWADTPLYVLASPQEWVTEGVRTQANLDALEDSKQAIVALNVNSHYIADPGYSLFTDQIHLTGDDNNSLLADTLFNAMKIH